MARPRKDLTINPELEKKINEEVAQYLTEKIAEREEFLRSTGAIFAESVNKSVLARQCGVSSMWITKILKGEKTANEEVLVKLADFLQIDQDNLFRVARKIPPYVMEEVKRKFLGDFGMEAKTEQEINQEVGAYLKQKIAEYEKFVKEAEQIKSYSLSKSELGRQCGVSSVWINEILTGNQAASEELLSKLADHLRIDKVELFRLARKIPPYLLDQTKREYLGEYYEEGC